jgi:hypothetical protein
VLGLAFAVTAGGLLQPLRGRRAELALADHKAIAE